MLAAMLVVMLVVMLVAMVLAMLPAMLAAMLAVRALEIHSLMSGRSAGHWAAPKETGVALTVCLRVASSHELGQQRGAHSAAVRPSTMEGDGVHTPAPACLCWVPLE